MVTKPITITFTEAQQARHRKAWAHMPYGSSIGINYDIDPEAMIANLESLQGMLTRHAKTNDQRDEELTQFRGAVRSLGTLLKMAAQEAGK